MDVISSTAFGLNINKDKELNKDFVSYAKKTITTNLIKPYFVAVCK